MENALEPMIAFKDISWCFWLCYISTDQIDKTN